MRPCTPGNHTPGCYCYFYTEQEKYPLNTQVKHTPRLYKEPSHGYGVVVKQTICGFLIVLFDSGERDMMSPFELTDNHLPKGD